MCPPVLFHNVHQLSARFVALKLFMCMRDIYFPVKTKVSHSSLAFFVRNARLHVIAFLLLLLPLPCGLDYTRLKCDFNGFIRRCSAAAHSPSCHSFIIIFVFPTLFIVVVLCVHFMCHLYMWNPFISDIKHINLNLICFTRCSVDSESSRKPLYILSYRFYSLTYIHTYVYTRTCACKRVREIDKFCIQARKKIKST